MYLTQETSDAEGADGTVTERRMALFGTGAVLRLSEKLRGFINAEPAPPNASEALCQRYGFLGLSARTGAVGSLKANHLIFEAALTGKTIPPWRRSDGRFVDPLRPGIEPEGLADAAEVRMLQQSHYLALRRVLSGMDELILVLDGTVHGRDAEAGEDYAFVPGADFPTSLRDRIAPHIPDMDDLDADFTLMWQRLNSVRPGLQITLALAPPQPGATPSRGQQRQLADLRCLMTEWSSRFDTVRYLPLWEVAQLGDGDAAAKMWAMATSLMGVSSPPAVPDEGLIADKEIEATEEERRAARRARKAAKRKRGNMAPSAVCEDELLEAFSK